MAKSLNISCVIAAHHEGIMLHWSLLSYEAMRVYAEERGSKVEWVIVLDRADEETVRVVNNFSGIHSDDKIIYADNGSLSLTRNDGIRVSRYDIICILDADDYFSKDYLYKSAVEVSKNNNYICHPNYMLSFGSSESIYKIPDMRFDKRINAYAMVFQHPYSSSVVAHKKIFQDVKYIKINKMFGFEDWHWNCETMKKKYIHIVSDNTFRFYRRRNDGMLSGMRDCIMPPTTLFYSSITEEDEKNSEELFFERASKFIEKTAKRWQYSIHKRTPYFVQKTLSQWKRFIVKRLPSNTKNDTQNETLPLSKLWRKACLELAAIDPKLHPSRFPSTLFEYVPHLHRDWGKLFVNICSHYAGKHFDVVYVVPWIAPGGADLMLLNHANFCSRHGKNVLVISTLGCRSSSWGDRVDAEVEFLELGYKISSLPYDIQITFLTKLLLQLAADNTHIIDSQLGHECLKKYGAALQQYTSLISTFYRDDIRQDGTFQGYVVDYLSDENSYVCKFSSDNKVLPKEWCARYGTELRKFHITYRMIPQTPSPRYLNASNNKIFWASRICDQTRPDILYFVARELPHIEFHIYGGKEDTVFADMVAKLEQLPNVVMKGEYAGFQTLPLSDYAAFLYTSKSDGLPNVLLEAGEAGMPIVGSVVGGIGDFLTEETGWPVHSNDPNDFVTALNEVFISPELAASKGKKARELVHKRHGEEAFWNNLVELYSFENPKAGSE